VPLPLLLPLLRLKPPLDPPALAEPPAEERAPLLLIVCEPLRVDPDCEPDERMPPLLPACCCISRTLFSKFASCSAMRAS
jgi:hypothetical protein